MTKTKLEVKPITLRDAPKITKYLNETGLKKSIIEIIAPTKEELSVTWADVREEGDLSLEELRDLKVATKGDLLLALRTEPTLNHLAPKERTREDQALEIFDIIYSVIDEEDIFNKTVEILAFMYNTDEETILNLTLPEMKEVITGIFNSSDFLS